MSQPLVSVLINNYNNGILLRDCVASVLDQDYPQVETIVYDDGSTDDSLQWLEPFRDRIKLLAPGTNYGSTSNFNQAHAIDQAFRRSRGALVFLLDGDDVFFPGKIRQVVEVFQQDPEVVLVQHRFREKFAADGSLGHIRPILLFDPTRYGEGYRDYMLRTHSLYDLFMQTSGLAFRRSYLEDRLPIREDGLDKIWADVRLTRQAPFFGKVVTLQSPLTYYLIHEKNDSKKLNDPNYLESFQAQLYQFFNNFLAEQGLPPVDRRKYLRRRRFLRVYRQKKWRQIQRWLGVADI